MVEWLGMYQEDVFFFISRQYCTLFFVVTILLQVELVNKLLRDLDRFHAKTNVYDLHAVQLFKKSAVLFHKNLLRIDFMITICCVQLHSWIYFFFLITRPQRKNLNLFMARSYSLRKFLCLYIMMFNNLITFKFQFLLCFIHVCIQNGRKNIYCVT